MNDITALKLAAIRAAAAISDYDSGRINVLEKRLAVEEYEKLVSEPANVLALVEALEKAQRVISEQDKQLINYAAISTRKAERIAELESHKESLLKFIRESCYVFDGYDADISDAYTDAASSSLMPKIEAEPCRYCSDGSYSGLPGGACEHCMGTGLDNPAAELESRTVTVKLPKAISVLHRRDFIDAHRSIYAYPEAELNAALAAAGIQVIEGEGQRGGKCE